jgi:hypothetical protein
MKSFLQTFWPFRPDATTLDTILIEIRRLIMTSAEAFEKIAKSDEQLKKGLAEVRTKIDAQTALIEKLQNTELTPEQETLVNDLSTQTQALDDIVPDAPPA